MSHASARAQAVLAAVPLIAAMLQPATARAAAPAAPQPFATNAAFTERLSTWRILADFKAELSRDPELQKQVFEDPAKAGEVLETRLRTELLKDGFEGPTIARELVEFKSLMGEIAQLSQADRSRLLDLVAKTPVSRACSLLQEFLNETIPVAWDEHGDRLPLPPRSPDGTVYLISNSTTNILGRGNAFVSIDEVVRRSDDRFIGHCPLAFANAAVTPKGHLAACCGCEVEDNPVLDVGNLLSGRSFAEVRDDADDRVLMIAIATLGRSFLKDVVEDHRPDLKFRNRYSNVCEICEEVSRRPDVVEVLREHIGEIASSILEIAPNGHSDMERLRGLAAGPRGEA